MSEKVTDKDLVQALVDIVEIINGLNFDPEVPEHTIRMFNEYAAKAAKLVVTYIQQEDAKENEQ